MTTTTISRIDPPALESRLGTAEAPRLVDVRTPGEHETAHVPGSVLLPLDDLQAHARRVAGDLGGEEVVLVCQSGARAERAAEALRDAGHDRLAVLDGGVNAWQQHGGEVNRGRDRWDMERQVRMAAGSIVLGAGLGSVLAPKLKWLATAIGGGLVFSAVSNTCAMGNALAKMPWNRADAPSVDEAIDRLRERGQ